MRSEFAVLEGKRIQDFMTEGLPDSLTSSVLCNFHFPPACPIMCGNLCFLAVVSRVNAQILI